MDTPKKTPVVRVGVPYPNNGSILPECKESLKSLLNCSSFDCKDNIYEVQGASISVLRNQVVTMGSNRVYQRNLPFDYYLCVDSDIEFTAEDVQKLIDCDVDIVSGAYKSRKNPVKAVAGNFTGVHGLIGDEDLVLWSESGLKEVDWVGAGFLLIKKQVLERMKYPYFRELITEYDSGSIPCAVWCGEDVGFCIAAKEAGFKIYVDMGVKVNHLINGAFESSQKPVKKQYTLAEAYELSVETLNTMKDCIDMFYNGLHNLSCEE